VDAGTAVATATDAGAETAPDVVEPTHVAANEPIESHPNFRQIADVRAQLETRMHECETRFGRYGRHVRASVQYRGSTGEPIDVRIAGNYWSGRPIGPCLESAFRSVRMPTFHEDRWDTDFTFMIH
jgi:hypothetical protein